MEESELDKPVHSRSNSDSSGQGVVLSVKGLNQSSSLERDVSLKSQPCRDATDDDPSHVRDATDDELSDSLMSQHSFLSRQSSESMGQSDSQSSQSRRRKSTVEDLQSALECLQKKLHQKDADIAKLEKMRLDMESEIEDLTASLFEEAHKMVRDANVKQASAEKALAEANMKIDGLETEVAALKTLVLTSTPAQPNKHLHPQLDTSKKKKKTKDNQGSNESVASNASSSSLLKLPNGCLVVSNGNSSPQATPNCQENSQASISNIDPVLRKEYLSWKKCPSLDRQHPFISRIYCEDIDLCLAFPNQKLTEKVRQAIHNNSLCLAPVKDFSDVPSDCALLQAPLLCKYSLKLDSDIASEMYHISELSRNRLISVCECVNYLRYVEQGLVKAHVNDVYWQIMQLRKAMTLARMGFAKE